MVFIKPYLAFSLLLLCSGCTITQAIFIENQTSEPLYILAKFNNEYGRHELDFEVSPNGGTNGWHYETSTPDVIEESLESLHIQNNRGCKKSLDREDIVSELKKVSYWELIVSSSYLMCN